MRVWFVTACVAFGACSDDEGEDDGNGDLPAVCQEIVDACHEADANGVDGAAECHETAHHGEQAACEADHDACVALCEAGV